MTLQLRPEETKLSLVQSRKRLTIKATQSIVKSGSKSYLPVVCPNTILTTSFAVVTPEADLDDEHNVIAPFVWEDSPNTRNGVEVVILDDSDVEPIDT